MHSYALDYDGFSNEDGDGCLAVFVDFPDIKGIGDTCEEAEADAYEQLRTHFNQKEQKMTTPFEQALSAYESKHFNEAYGLFEEAASRHDPHAMVNLAVMHMHGRGCTQSTETAKEWFEKAAEQGSIHAMVSLGRMYEKGVSGSADMERALHYYKGAADLGHVDAQLKSGLLYRERGEITRAMQYLITAAHNSNAQAQEIITYVSNADLATERNLPFRSLDPGRQRVLVEQMIETKIRPTLAADNGGIELANYLPGETPQIWLNYLGACSGCHLGSTSTADMLLDHFETLIDKNVVLYLM